MIKIRIEFKDRIAIVECDFKFSSYLDAKNTAIELIKETIKGIKA